MANEQDPRYYYENAVGILAEMVITYLTQAKLESQVDTDQDNLKKVA